MNAFHVLGGVLALWAVIVASLGVTRPGFPGRGGERIVTLVSVALVVATIGAAIVTGAAEDEGESASAEEPQSGALRVRADRGGRLAFDTDRLEARSGQVTIAMENRSRIRHNVGIEGNGIEVEGQIVDPGGTSTVSAQLEPGEYEFYCSVLGHREGGMSGTLTVR